MRLHLSGHMVDAVSVGGVETCYQLPDFGVCLDIGRCPDGAISQGKLLLTHAHIDHAAGLPYYISMRSMRHNAVPKVYVPRASHADLREMLEVWARLQADTTVCELIPVGPGDEIGLRNNGVAKVFASPHRIATVGYTIFRKVKKLKPGYAGLHHHEIAELVRGGEEVSEEKVVPEICFPGDTMIDVVEKEETVRTSRVLMLECTFLGPDVDVDRAREGGHIHLDQIAERADLFENETILLTHFSKRYRPEEIRAEVNRRLPLSLLDRVQLLIDPEH